MISIQKRKLLESLLEDNSFFILSGNNLVMRNGDVAYPFRQDSDMLLLTGVSSPNIVLTCAKQNSVCEWKIFTDPFTPHEEVWGTERLGHSDIQVVSGIQTIVPLISLSPYISSIMENIEYVYMSESNPYEEELRLYHIKELSLREVLDPLRIKKLPEEIEKIKKAIRVTHEAFDTVKESIRPGMYEYEVEAIIAGVFRSHHLTEAYPTIVACGVNACTLHYISKASKIEKGDLVLIDFGCEYEGYASDITRVFAISDVSLRQKQVYESVIRVQEFTKSIIKPGVKKSEYERIVREKMNEELVGLGLIPHDCSLEQKEILSRKYYPHSVSHFLGLDVHDIGGRDTVLEAGMVLTCEPGIYIKEEGIGVRLEDDFLVTESGYENLSCDIPTILQK